MTKRKTVRKWYMEAYPNDEYGSELTPGVTFEQAYFSLMYGGGDRFYNRLNVADTLIRERIFEKMTEIFHRDYDHFYDLMLNPIKQVVDDDDDDDYELTF